MRPQRPISEEAKKSLEKLLKKAKTKGDYQRIQCVWLRAAFGLPSANVAEAVGWSAGRVRHIWSEYFAEGERALIGVGRGGRRHENLSEEEERRLLSGFFKKAKKGGVLVVSEVKVAYEETIGRRVPKSTVYRMLARHGWRKIAPRPRHPKGDARKREAFKKNSRRLFGKR